jgi:hypothetical protein
MEGDGGGKEGRALNNGRWRWERGRVKCREGEIQRRGRVPIPLALSLVYFQKKEKGEKRVRAPRSQSPAHNAPIAAV